MAAESSVLVYRMADWETGTDRLMSCLCVRPIPVTHLTVSDVMSDAAVRRRIGADGTGWWMSDPAAAALLRRVQQQNDSDVCSC